MRPAIYVSFLLLLLLQVATAQVRLEGDSLAALRKKLQEEDQILWRGGKLVGGAVLCNKGSASGTRKMKISTSARKVHHRFPGFHEDYYGPRNHSPKHH